MKQLSLFGNMEVPASNLDTFVEREGDALIIPEGLHTVPCTHGIHRFPGKFIPNIPRYLLRECVKTDTERVIFDPFCGSGTTLIEAALEGRPFVGMDIDPLSVMISTAKTQLLTEDELRFLEGFWKDHHYDSIDASVVPDVPNFTHWFTERATQELSSIKSRCIELPDRLRLFSLVVFSSIIRRVSNADDQTQKTYVSHTLPKNPPAPSELFPVFLERSIAGMRDYAGRLNGVPYGQILQGDVRRDIGESVFDDVITSPPYIDSLDYVYNQMLEYFWLLPELGIGTYDGYRQFRKEPMGFRENVGEARNAFINEYLPDLGEDISNLTNEIHTKSPREAQRVWAFFEDYVTHLKVVRAKQRPGGAYICVIGNSHIRGVTIPTAEAVVSIHRAMGYALKDRMTYEIRRHYMKFPRRHNSGTIKQDHILVFEVE